jgi:hypothetical protein
MTGRRKTRKSKSDETTAAFIVAAAAVFAIYTAHLWGWVCVTAAIALVSYAAGRRRKRHRAPAARRPPRLRAPRGRRRTVTLSAACAGNDHPLCRDRLCNCLCDHPHRQRAYAGDAPLPADDVPPF